MTTNDDSNLQVVERDLRALAEPRSGDDLIRLAVREQLAAKLCPRPRRRLSLRIVFRSATVAAAAAALAVVALVATNGTGGTSSADAAIIHHVLREVSPPAHKILHVEVVGMQNGMTVVGETWEQTSPPYAFRGLKGAVGQQGEFAVNGTTSFSYDPRTNTIYASPSSSPPTFADPLLQVRQELARGQAQDVGTAMIGGTPLYKINLPHGLVGYFDESNYLPRYLDDPQSDGTVLRLRVAAQHPGARLDTSRSAGVATK